MKQRSGIASTLVENLILVLREKTIRNSDKWAEF